MSTSTALTIVGAAAGFAMGGPAGAQWGAMIGGTLGGIMQANATHMRGPRLADLTVQKSEEGAPIPVLFGAVRVAGNVLQCSEKRERAHKTSAGKGSGPKSTNYTYDVDLAVEICGTTDPLTGANTPIVGMRRIWANGNLIYDTSAGASAAALLASGKVAANITLYTGTETQLPDPTLETLTGVGATPAYRGKAYVVFTALQLANFGNNIPNFTFEVIGSGSRSPYRRLTAATLPQTWRNYYAQGLGTPCIFSADDVVRVGVAGEIGAATYIYDLSGAYLGKEPRSAADAAWPIAKYTADGIHYWGVGRLWDGSALYFTAPARLIIGAQPTLQTGGAYDVHKSVAGGLPAGRQLLSTCLSADGRHVFSITGPAGASNGSASGDQWHLCEWTGSSAVLVRQGTIDPPMHEYIFGPGSQTSAGMSHGGFSSGMLEDTLAHVWTVSGSGSYAVKLYELGADSVMRNVKTWGTASGDGFNGTSNPWTTIYATAGVCVTLGGSGFCVHTRLPAVEPSQVPLSGVVSKLCTRAGLLDADVDASQLSDTLHGYAISTQASARAALDPLRQYAPFDVTESDGKLLFVPRGAPVAATIPWADLAAHAGGSQPEPLELTLADEAEIINGVTVVFPDPDASYQPSAQAARRNRVSLAGQSWQVPASVNEQRTELPICMSPARGARIAEQLLWEAYTARKTAKFAVGIKYAALKPSDVVVIVSPDATYRLRITRITEQGLLRQVEAVFEDSALYAAAPASAPSAGVPAQSVSVAGHARMMLLDIPLLRDADDGPGFYLAVGRYLPGWPGATVYVSADSGQTWDDVQTFANTAILGGAEDALPNWLGGNTFDESSRVTVRVSPGLQLASISADAVLAGGNAALLGSEIVQFRDAQLVGANLYRLSGLLRGRRGTEWAMGGHTAGERFALLSGVAGLARIPGSAADIGATRSYKAVTAGESLDSAAAVEFANAAAGLKPYAPVHINAGRDVSGNIVITWVRRARVDGEWRDYADAALGETAEQYEVDILDPVANVVRRTLQVTSSSATYSVYYQAVDFGEPISSVRVRVYQISSVVGRGTAGEASIALPPSAIGSSMAAAGLAVYAPVVYVGSTAIATVSGIISGTAKTRYFGSADGGATWSQIGADTPAPAVVRPWPRELVAALSSGLWAGFQPTRWNDLNTPNWFAAAGAVKPAYTGAQLLAGRWPHALASDGTQFVCMAEGNRIFTSADAVTWADRGQMSGDIGVVVELHPSRVKLTGAARLYRGAGCWLLWMISEDRTVHAIYRTVDPVAQSGWVKVLDLQTGYGRLDHPGTLEKVGGVWMLITHGFNSSGGGGWLYSSIIWRSADDGVTWTSETFSGEVWSGVYMPGLDGPYAVGSAICFFEQGSNKGIRYTSSWAPFTATGIPAFDGTGNIISTGSALIARSNTAGGIAMWRSADGINWTSSTGITIT